MKTESAMYATNVAMSPIQEFYRESKVFVTGATGFLGQLLVEKLLRSCHVKTIYVMIREKKGKEIDVRLRELFDSVVFDRLRQENPDFSRKIVGLYGDCAKIKLGMKEEDQEVLIKNVNFVFHCAATVNFEEKLSMATLINIRGTQEILKLSKKMQKLMFFTHVSTAYAHCEHKKLSETFYEFTYSPQQLITIVEQLPEELVTKIENSMLGQYPNTYVFTKTISEQLIADLADFPAAMYRPAIIVSTFKEPLAGWINNFYGPQGVTAGAMIGLVRTLQCDEQVKANIVPVDMCVNGMLAIAWDARKKYEEVEKYNKNAMEVDEHTLKMKIFKAPIYHFESNSSNPITWKVFREFTQKYGYDFISVKMIGIYFFHLRKNYFSNLMATIFLHFLPAICMDFFLICTGKKPRMVQTYKKVFKFSSVISYFCTQNWQYDSRNYYSMCDKMALQDSDIFYCDLRRLNWATFCQTYLLGCRLYLIKDPIETIATAQKMNKKFYVRTCCVLSGIVLLFGVVVYNLFKTCSYLL